MRLSLKEQRSYHVVTVVLIFLLPRAQRANRERIKHLKVLTLKLDLYFCVFLSQPTNNLTDVAVTDDHAASIQ